MLKAPHLPSLWASGAVGVKVVFSKGCFSSGDGISATCEWASVSVCEADGPGATLWPNPSFFPMRLAPANFNQVFELAAYDPLCLQNEKANSAELVCSVRNLRYYTQATAGFCYSDSLFVAMGAIGTGMFYRAISGVLVFVFLYRGFILYSERLNALGTLTAWSTFIAIYLIVVTIFQSRWKWWTALFMIFCPIDYEISSSWRVRNGDWVAVQTPRRVTPWVSGCIF